MTCKDRLKNDIIVKMRLYLDTTQMSVLEAVIVQVTRNLDITEQETLPATVDNTNDYILNLFMARKAPKLKKTTVDAYMLTIRELIALVNKPLNQITEGDIEYYLYKKSQQGNNNTSLNNCRRNISAFYTWMRKVKIVTENPCEGIDTYTQVEKPIDHLEPTEWELLKKGCTDTRSRALIEFMRCTAMRRGEIPQVNICDIDFSTGAIIIYGQKSCKYRTVYLDKVAIYYIREYMKERGVSESSEQPLFTHLYGDTSIRLEDRGIYSLIKTIGRRANMDKRIYPHLFRKTTATTIVKRGGSEDAAGEYLGHAPRNVTGKHYTYKSTQYVEQIFHNFVESV